VLHVPTNRFTDRHVPEVSPNGACPIGDTLLVTLGVRLQNGRRVGVDERSDSLAYRTSLTTSFTDMCERMRASGSTGVDGRRSSSVVDSNEPSRGVVTARWDIVATFAS
jgi:hypothetical protein